MTTCPFNPSDDGAQMSFDGRMSYGDYLQIDKILNAQHCLTEAVSYTHLTLPTNREV